MAATRFLDSASPTSYSTPNTLWGLTCTVTDLPGGNLSITPWLRPSDIEIFRISMKHTHFFRNSTEFISNSNNAILFKFSESIVWQGFCRFVQKKIRHTGSQFRPKVGQSWPKTKFQIFKFPRNGGQLAQPATIFIRPSRQ